MFATNKECSVRWRMIMMWPVTLRIMIKKVSLHRGTPLLMSFDRVQKDLQECRVLDEAHQKCPPTCTILDEVNVKWERSDTKEVSPAQVVVVLNDMEASEIDSREIFSCPFCLKTYFVKKIFQNNCTRVCGWSYTRNQARSGRETGCSQTQKNTSICAESPLRAQALKRESNGDLLTDKNSKCICIYPLKGLLD